jgi:uncharacterized protein (TIGR02266 family)
VIVQLAYRSPAAFLVAYATQLSKGGVFVETASPLAAGAPVTLHLATPPATTVVLTAQVAWVRAPATPGQPAGMALALTSPQDALGAAVDGVAFGFRGVCVLLRTGEAAPRAILSRYLRSIVSSCEIVDGDAGHDGPAGGASNGANGAHGAHGTNGGSGALDRLDLAIIDLDSSGPAGFQLGASLRAPERGGPVPVPVLALAGLERDRARAVRAGFDQAVANPPSFADLEAAVLRCLARPGVTVVS